MYRILLVIFFIFSSAVYSQSPYYSVKFSVGSTDRIEGIDFFKIELTTCRFEYDPVIPSGDYWFGKDTSVLDWDNLPDSLINKLKCSSDNVNGSVYEYSNQAMVWENIYAIRITRNFSDTMLIVFPVRIKSFVTHINLGIIPFKTGLYDLTDIITYTFKDWLYLEIPANYKWLPGNNTKGISKLIK